MNFKTSYKTKVLTLSMLLLSVGCATKRDGIEQMRLAVKQKDFEKAVAIVKSDDFMGDEKSQLLKFMESALSSCYRKMLYVGNFRSLYPS